MRTIDASVQTELAAVRLSPIALVELDFDSGMVRLWTGIGELTWNGFTWYGAGSLGKIGNIEETAELRAVGLDMSLSGLPKETFGSPPKTIVQIALEQTWQNREAKAYYGVLNSVGVLIGTPFQIFGGRMDQMLVIEGEVASITLSCESDLIDLERAKVRRYTPEDQRGEYSLDAGFDSVAALQEKEIKWGRGF